MTDVRIIIATFNASDLLKRCLQSIYENTKKHTFEIIVIDNNSTDDTVSMVESSFSTVKIVKNRKNEGVSKGRNKGLENIGSNFVLLLDADTEITNGAIDKMIDFVADKPNIGICGAKLISPNGELQLTCRRYHNFLIPFFRRMTFFNFIKKSRILNDFLMTNWDHQVPKKVDQVIGACQLIRRDVVEKIGLLDKRMFYGWEDTDYCVRAMKAGFDTWYFPDSVIIHHEQRITKKKIFSRLFFENINLL